jgi:hypothetical protein
MKTKPIYPKTILVRVSKFTPKQMDENLRQRIAETVRKNNEWLDA